MPKGFALTKPLNLGNKEEYGVSRLLGEREGGTPSCCAGLFGGGRMKAGGLKLKVTRIFSQGINYYLLIRSDLARS